MKPNELADVAARLSSVLGDGSLLIGGLAVAAWGHVRATEDVDFVSKLDPEEIQSRLEAHAIGTELRRGDVLEGDIPWVLHGHIGNVTFQVLPPLVPIAWENALAVELSEETEIAIVDLPDLIRLKIRAGGPRDLWDVAVLLKQHDELTDDARAWAEELERGDDLDAWLNDPRL